MLGLSWTLEGGNVSAHPFELASKLAYLVAAAVSIALGVLAKSAILSILIGAALFTVGYFLARAPQIHRLITVDGKNPFFLFLFMTIFHCILSGIFYGVGRIFS